MILPVEVYTPLAALPLVRVIAFPLVALEDVDQITCDTPDWLSAAVALIVVSVAQSVVSCLPPETVGPVRSMLLTVIVLLLV